MIKLSITSSFGADIAREIINYCNRYNEIWETFKTLWDAGMEDEAVETLTGRAPIMTDGSTESTEKAFSELRSELDSAQDENDNTGGELDELDMNIWGKW